jgi:peptidoglycan hydrolase-like protein with peptidoglycan-binding domain
MSTGNPNRDQARGFAGLQSFVSQIPDEPCVVEPQASTDSTAGVSYSGTLKTEKPASAETRTSPQSPTLTPSTSPGSKVSRLVLGALAAGILITILSQNGKNTNLPPIESPPPYTPMPSPYPPSRPEPPRSEPGSRTEDIPLPGDGARTFTQGNIRWCLFQDRRLEIIRLRIRASIDESQSSSFNALIDDFNNRCGRYRYREADMSVVRGEIPLREVALQLQADEIITNWRNRRQPSLPERRENPTPYSPQEPPFRPPAPALPTGSEIVVGGRGPQLDLLRIEDATKVQRRLADLRFFAGNPDGIWSRRSRRALCEFKAKNGLTRDDAWDGPTEAQLLGQDAMKNDVIDVKSGQVNVPDCKETSYPSAAGTAMNQLNPNVAIWLQSRLADHGFDVGGKADGIWGNLSRKAFREFKMRNGLAEDQMVDAETERSLTAESFIGAWANNDADCRLAPIQITWRDAKSKLAICNFKSIRREDSGWRIQAECTAGKGTTLNNIRIAVSNRRLTWSVEGSTTQTFERCGGG